MIYIVYGILGVLVLLILFILIGLVFSRGSTTPEATQTPASATAPASGFFANERHNTNLGVEKAKLDGGRSAANFLEESLPNRGSLPAREYGHDEEDEYKL